MAENGGAGKRRPARSFWREHGLSLVVFGLFAVCWIGQLLAGWSVENSDREERDQPPLSLTQYVRSAHALEATAENWESEFLQMCAFAILTAHLFQRGSAESRDPDKAGAPNSARISAHAPWPVKQGGWIRKIYEHSLSLGLGVLFVISLVLHIRGGAGLFNEERAQQGDPPLSAWEFLGTPQFWFESLQNWQSEFLSIGAMVVLTIFLREKNSPESKRVETPLWSHDE